MLKNPTVFISYSLDSKEHYDWVLAFTNELRKNGVNAEVDQFISQTRTVNINKEIINNIKNRDYILTILTEKYAEEADGYIGSVGYTTQFLNHMIQKI